MPELFPGMHIRDMYFNDRSCHSTDSILQSYRSVRISSCIQHNSIIRKPYFMDFINQFPLYIRLIVFYLYIGILCFQRHQIIFKRNSTVN